MSFNPILDALKSGNQFSFMLLKHETDALAAFWDWWWANCYDGSLTRPKTIQDDDHILGQTAAKPFADTISNDEFFTPVLRKFVATNQIPRGTRVPRDVFREKVVDILLPEAPPCSNRAICFTGGGYGAGKTVTLQHLVKTLDIQMKLETEVLHGVDYCKQLLPEFNILKGMADGRASEVCQTESRLISDAYFQRAVNEGRNFGWDSSMSNLEATQAKINHARSNGYGIDMIAVLTRIEVAILRAMRRARLTRRFAPPLYLESSHRDFWGHLPTYIPLFDRVWIFENSGDRQDPMLIAVKPSERENIQILDGTIFESYVNSPLRENT